MSWPFSEIVEFVEDAAEVVTEVVDDIGDAVEQVVETAAPVLETVLDTAAPFAGMVGTALGGVAAPWVFGLLIGTGRPEAVAFGYAVGAALMIGAGALAWRLAVPAERVRQAMGAWAFEGAPDDCRVTVSIGVGVFDSEAMNDADALIRVADAALYEAKRAGKNRVQRAPEDMG